MGWKGDCAVGSAISAAILAPGLRAIFNAASSVLVGVEPPVDLAAANNALQVVVPFELTQAARMSARV